MPLTGTPPAPATKLADRLPLVAAALLLTFAATLGIDVPAPPIPGHAAWADVAMAGCALALLAWFALRPRLVLSRLRESLSPAPTALAAAYALWSLASAAHAGRGYWKALGIAELACVFAIAQLLCGHTIPRGQVLRAFVLGVAFLALTGLVGSALGLAGHPDFLTSRGGAYGWVGRPKGLATGLDLLATLCLPAALLVLDGEALEPRFGRTGRTVLLVVLFATLALSLSRTLLALAFAFVLLRVRSRRLRVVATAALLVPLAIAFRYDLVRPGRLYLSSEPSLRLRIARGALDTIREEPVYGAGPDGPVTVLSGWPTPSSPPRRWDAHLTWLDVPANLGLPALLLYAAFVALAMREAFRTPDEDGARTILLVCLAALLFESLSIDVEDFRHGWLLFGLALAPGGALDLTRSRLRPQGPSDPSGPSGPSSPSPPAGTAGPAGPSRP